MKFKYLFIIFIFSCSLNIENEFYIKNEKLEYYMNLYSNNEDKINYLGDYVNYFVEKEFNNIEYNPEEIKKRKKGDCSERVTYFGWLVYQYFGIKPVFYRSYGYKNGILKYHRSCYIPKYDYWFNQWGTIYKKYSFDEYFWNIKYNKTELW